MLCYVVHKGLKRENLNRRGSLISNSLDEKTKNCRWLLVRQELWYSAVSRVQNSFTMEYIFAPKFHFNLLLFLDYLQSKLKIWFFELSNKVWC